MMRSACCKRNVHGGGRCDCQKQMQTLRALDFAIQETALYLDAYPENCQALAYYHHLMEERRAALAEYENNCGPVTMFGNTDESHWHWIDSPWPWEADANR